MSTLRDQVREAATERTWTQGVTLARDQRVVGRGRAGDELELEVRVPSRPTPFAVTINPALGEWECECPSREEVCSHVVAAVLAVEQQGEAPVSETIGAPVRYLLEPTPGGIKVERVLVEKDGTTTLKTSLLSMIAGGNAGKVAATDADLQADKILGVRVGPISGEKLDRLLGVLADARDVRWRGDPISTSAEPVLPRALVEDSKGGVRVRLEADKEIIEIATLGVVRMPAPHGARPGAPDVLRPIGAADLCGSKLEQLPTNFEVGRAAFPELIAKTLPGLAARIHVEIRASSLPKIGARETPRMVFDVVQEGETLNVLPTLVYGEPPRARIDAGRLVHLGGALPLRDEDAERRLTWKLRDELNMVPGRRVAISGRDAFMVQGKLAGWLRSDARAATDVRAVELEANLAIEGSRIDLTFANGGKSAPTSAVLRAWQAGVDLVPLAGGGWGRVPMAWLDQHGTRLADLLAARGGDKRVPIYALPDLARLCEDLNQPPPADLARLKPLLDGFEGIPVQIPPAPLEGLLRPYQQRGLDWLAFCRDAGLGCVLADDMGLGKTIQALAAMKGRTLVVSPTSVLFNWRAEAARFRPDLTVATYHGTRRSLENDADLVLTTYPILRNDIDTLADAGWDTVILDESQTIKNPDSQVARAAYRLKAKWKLTMSGTPVENRLDELWSQLHFTNPGLLGGRADFQERWALPITEGDAGAGKRLRERIRPFVLRRMKREVAKELPPRTDAVMYVELDDTERATYDAIRAATQRDIVALLEAGGGVMAALEALLRLRQAACHTALLPGGPKPPPDGSPLGSSKLTRLLGALEDAVADGHRALVFSQWTSLLDLIEPHLKAAGFGFVRLDGSTKDRQGVVGAFQDENGPPVMLLSLKAGGTGLNLTAADHVFLLDPWWNPAVEDQAADRAHRIGQDKPVMVYRMVARDTVEERILVLQDLKRGLADAALGEADRAVSISRDDLLALLA
jgi:superfamily II DNA or RNA helicase